MERGLSQLLTSSTLFRVPLGCWAEVRTRLSSQIRAVEAYAQQAISARVPRRNRRLARRAGTVLKDPPLQLHAQLVHGAIKQVSEALTTAIHALLVRSAAVETSSPRHVQPGGSLHALGCLRASSVMQAHFSSWRGRRIATSAKLAAFAQSELPLGCHAQVGLSAVLDCRKRRSVLHARSATTA